MSLAVPLHQLSLFARNAKSSREKEASELSVRIRNTSRDRANCSCLFALSLCAAAVEHQDELFALLSYETAGIAAFLRLHTEDAGENHPEYERIARAHISGRRTTELPQQILERKSHDVKWLALRRGLSSGQSQESENNKMRSVYHRHHMNQWRLKSTWLVSQV